MNTPFFSFLPFPYLDPLYTFCSNLSTLHLDVALSKHHINISSRSKNKCFIFCFICGVCPFPSPFLPFNLTCPVALPNPQPPTPTGTAHPFLLSTATSSGLLWSLSFKQNQIKVSAPDQTYSFQVCESLSVCLYEPWGV